MSANLMQDIQRFQKSQDVKTLARIFDQTAAPLWQLACVKTPLNSQAEKVLQRVYARFIRQVDSFDRGCDPFSWFNSALGRVLQHMARLGEITLLDAPTAAQLAPKELTFDPATASRIRTAVIGLVRPPVKSNGTTNYVTWVVAACSLCLLFAVVIMWDRSPEATLGTQPETEILSEPRAAIRRNPGVTAPALSNQNPRAIVPSESNADQLHYPRFFHLKCIPMTNDSKDLILSHIQVRREWETGDLGRSETEWIRFDVDLTGEVMGELEEDGNYHGHLVFKNNKFTHQFQLRNVGRRPLHEIRHIRYAYSASIRWLYSCDFEIESAKLTRASEKESAGYALACDGTYMTYAGEVIFPQYLSVVLKNGRTWGLTIFEEPSLIDIRFGPTLTVFATDLRNGFAIESAYSKFRYEGADVSLPAIDTGECMIPIQSNYTIVAPGYLPTTGRSKNHETSSAPEEVPLISMDASGLRFVDSKEEPMPQMGVLFAWLDKKYATAFGHDFALKGTTNEDGFVEWNKLGRLELLMLDGTEDAADRKVRVVLRNPDQTTRWQSDDSFLLRDMAQERTVKIPFVPDFKIRVIGADGEALKIKHVRGVGLVNNVPVKPGLALSRSKTNAEGEYDFGALYVEAVVVRVELEGAFPQIQTFATGSTGAQEFHLKPMHVLKGVVRDTEGQGIAKSFIHCFEITGGVLGHQLEYIYTDENGQFSVALPAGRRFFIGASAPSGKRIDMWPPHFLVDSVEKNEINFLGVHGQSIKLVVEDENGRELPKPALTNPFFADLKASFHAVREYPNRKLGRKSGPRHLKLPPEVDFDTMVVAPRVIPSLRSFRVSAGQEELRVRLQAGPALQGQVNGKDGVGRNKLQVQVRAVSLDNVGAFEFGYLDRWTEIRRTDAAGQFRFEALTPGDYELRLINSEGSLITKREISVRQDTVLPPIDL